MRFPNRLKAFRILIPILLLLTLGLAEFGIKPAQGQSGSPVTITGSIAVVWGDGGPDSKATKGPMYFITEKNKKPVLLDISKELEIDLGGPAALLKKQVVVQGNWIHAPGQEKRTAVLQANTVQIQQMAGATGDAGAVSGPQPWVSILCKFADIADFEPNPLSYFQGMYSSTYPGLNHYWREQSFNIINLNGSSAAGWFTLPQPRSYYIYDQNADGEPELDHTRILDDCTAVADPFVYFPNFVGINMMFNVELDGYAYGASGWPVTVEGETQTLNVTWEPPWGYQNLTVMGHEMGHGFGLPHSSGHYGFVYDNQWDVMSDIWTHCHLLSDPTYGCLGQHTISAHKNQLNWIAARSKFTATVSTTPATITLQRLALPPGGNYLMAIIPIQNSPTHYYTVELRRLVGYDAKLPGQGVIIHEVINGYALIVDIDNNGDTGDAGAIWIPGESFSDPANEITVTINSSTASGSNLTITNSYPVCYSLDIFINPIGSVDASPAPNCRNGFQYIPGTTVQLTATPNPGYLFSNWSGDVNGSNGSANQISITMDDNKWAQANFSAVATSVDVFVGGAKRANYDVGFMNSMRVSYAGINNGPVKIQSTNGTNIVASERVTYSPDGGTTWTSYSELMGLPSNQLTTSYTFPWYNNKDLDSQLRFGNVGTANTTVTVTIGGVVKGIYDIAPNASQRISYPGLDAGPIRVVSSGQPILASLRVAYFDGSDWTSFSEMMGMPTPKLTNSYVFPWYNNVDLNSQLRFGNVGSVTTTVTVTVGGVFKGVYTLTPNASQRVSYAGLDAGPVRVTSSGNVPIIASMRVAYFDGSDWTSFSELMGLPSDSLSTKYLFPYYNNAAYDTQLRFGNLGNTSTNVTVLVGGVFQGTYTLVPNQTMRVSYAGLNTGPVTIESSGGVPIVASERVAYFNGNVWTSFAEMMGLPESQLATTYLFPWYNNTNLNTQLRFGVP